MNISAFMQAYSKVVGGTLCDEVSSALFFWFDLFDFLVVFVCDGCAVFAFHGFVEAGDDGGQAGISVGFHRLDIC